MGKLKKKIMKITHALFTRKKEKEEDLSESLFSMVKLLKREEKKFLKAIYPKIQSPTDLQIARVWAKQKSFPEKE